MRLLSFIEGRYGRDINYLSPNTDTHIMGVFTRKRLSKFITLIEISEVGLPDRIQWVCYLIEANEVCLRDRDH